MALDTWALGSTGAGAVHLAQVDVVLTSELAHKRRREQSRALRGGNAGLLGRGRSIRHRRRLDSRSCGRHRDSRPAGTRGQDPGRLPRRHPGLPARSQIDTLVRPPPRPDQADAAEWKALAEKLNGYQNKHLVMYPFGPPGNLTAALSDYVLPSNLHDLLPPRLNSPLADVHLWLMYRYGNSDVAEGLHVCSGHWAKFGTTLPK